MEPTKKTAYKLECSKDGGNTFFETEAYSKKELLYKIGYYMRGGFSVFIDQLLEYQTYACNLNLTYCLL
jgi:hypothetical protein